MGGLEAQILESEHLIIGEDRPVTVNVKQSDGSTAQTMTGWTLQWKLMSGRAGTALITKTPTVQDGVGTDDQASFTISASDWSLITKSQSLFHTLSRIDTGNVQVLAFGGVVVHAALATA